MTHPSTEIVNTKGNARHSGLLTKLTGAYRWLASRELLACCTILLLTLGLRAALSPWLPVPQPTIHDEFSYLLAADTYAHGRLTNPPHPFWQHFETFHVLQQPTYASKYQPLQGLILAFGQKLFGLPWIGVYLSAGVMCAAMCWMLQGWISPNWALLGAILFMLRVGVLSYWMNSYLGGAVPAIGGALALGAVARIWRRQQFRHSITWALGLAIVVLSRPYDAAVLTCATAAVLLWFLRKTHTPWSAIGSRVALPALRVGVVCAAAIAYNDYRVTGDALTLPYQAHERQYAIASMFVMVPLGPEPPYRHPVIRQFQTVWTASIWKDARTHPLQLVLMKLISGSEFFFGFWKLFLVVLLYPYALKTSEERVTVFLMLVFAVMLAPLISAAPHYFASFAGVFYLRFLHTLRRLRSWRPRGWAVGQALGILLIILLLGTDLNSLAGVMRNREEAQIMPVRDLMTRYLAYRSSHFGHDRNSVVQTLQQQKGRHLVLLRYGPEHNPLDEWVYNPADIDASPIVWAHEMGPAQDRPLIEYFRERQVWLLEPDRFPLKLSPYPGEGQDQR